MAEIRVQDLRKEFGSFTAVRESSFTVQSGEFFVMLGPSGCGKTTTLRMVAGLELPTSGQILLDGEDVTFKRASERDIAFVFQLFALYPHMSVGKNIGFPLLCAGVPKDEARRRVEETAKMLRIDHLLSKPVSGLAGGDRQRVALGRAVVRRPKAFMMDEPLGALDTEFRELMIHELGKLHARLGSTTVYVTHDQHEAMAMADKIVVMNHGIIEQFGSPQEIYDVPASMYVAEFIGSPSMNFIRFQARVDKGSTAVMVGDVEIPIPEVRQPVSQTSLVLGVRPEHVSIHDDNGLPAEVIGTEYLGTTQIATFNSAFGKVKARIASTVPVRRGDRAALRFTTNRLSLFDAETGRAIATSLQAGTPHG